MALPADQLSRVPPPEDPHHVTRGESRNRRASRPHQNRAICTRPGVSPTLLPTVPNRPGSTVRIAVVTLRNHPGRLTGEVKHRRWGRRGPSLPGASARRRRCPMATTSTSTSTAVAAVEPVFTEPERLALAGFLAGYTGLTRQAYALDLPQHASWCQQNHLRLFQARRGGVECFARRLGT